MVKPMFSKDQQGPLALLAFSGQICPDDQRVSTRMPPGCLSGKWKEGSTSDYYQVSAIKPAERKATGSCCFTPPVIDGRFSSIDLASLAWSPAALTRHGGPTLAATAAEARELGDPWSHGTQKIWPETRLTRRVVLACLFV